MSLAKGNSEICLARTGEISVRRKVTARKWIKVREPTSREVELLEGNSHALPVDFHSWRRAYCQSLAELASIPSSPRPWQDIPPKRRTRRTFEAQSGLVRYLKPHDRKLTCQRSREGRI